MTFNEFRLLNIGKKVEVVGDPQNQCVDLVNAYLKDCFDINVIRGNANDFPVNAPQSKFQYIKNTLWNIPPEGAICVWNGNVGNGNGHLAIIIKANLLTFTSLDQNWPKGSPVAEVKHNYKDVEGFLIVRPKDIVSEYARLRSSMYDLLAKFPPVNS
jgi:hypothetical protein